MAALEARGRQLGGKEEGDPRIKKCAEMQEETRNALRAAGGRSLGRLVFGLVEGEKEIKKWEGTLQKSWKELEEAQREVRRREKLVEVAQVSLSNARAMQTNRGFQVAAEMAGHTSGYESLETALSQVQQALIDGGDSTARAAPAFHQVQHFVQSFARVAYSEEADPMLRELDSDSDATHSERNSVDTVVYFGQVGRAVREWQQGWAACSGQQEAPQDTGEGRRGQEKAEGGQVGASRGGAEAADKAKEGGAEAFQKAALVPVPNSDGSSEPAAPLPKRSRGSSFPVPRAAPWVGGPTGGDVDMRGARRNPSTDKPAHARGSRTAARERGDNASVRRGRSRTREKSGRGSQMLAIRDVAEH